MNQTDTLANVKTSFAARVFALIVAIALAISSFSISSVAFAAEGNDEGATTELVATQEDAAVVTAETASEEDSTIEDEENPLAAFDSIACKVHFWMFIGMALTAVYGAAIVLRRSKHAHDNNDFEKTILGKRDNKDKTYAPQGAHQLT